MFPFPCEKRGREAMVGKDSRGDVNAAASQPCACGRKRIIWEGGLNKRGRFLGRTAFLYSSGNSVTLASQHTTRRQVASVELRDDRIASETASRVGISFVGFCGNMIHFGILEMNTRIAPFFVFLTICLRCLSGRLINTCKITLETWTLLQMSQKRTGHESMWNTVENPID